MAGTHTLLDRDWRHVLALLTLLWAWACGAPAHAQADPTAPTGIVRVTSPVPGASVYVDNELAGEAPIVRYLSVGPHTIRISVDHYDPFVRRIEVVAGTTTEVTAQMIPGQGSVEFLVQPMGATLTISGQEPVKTPVRLRDLKPGTYEYTLEATGHEPEEGSFTFAKGKNLFIATHLKSTAGLVLVRSDPPGARVWLDGESVGATPLALEGVALAAHVVRLELPSHAMVYRRFDNSDGSKGVIEVKMGTQGASLAVETGSDQGEVRLEGQVVGTGETVRIAALERGRYALEVRVPERQPATLDIEIPSRGRLQLQADMAPLDGRGPSRITEVKPLVERWTFWAATAAGAGALGGGTILVATALNQEPVPTSATAVILP